MVNQWQLLIHFPLLFGKLAIAKTLATNVEDIINPMIGNNVLANYW